MKELKTAVVLAEFWVPVQSVNVKQHGSAGVGHICAVDSARLPPCQTLADKHTLENKKVNFSQNCRHRFKKTWMTSTRVLRAARLFLPKWARSPRCRTWRGETRRPHGPRPRCPSASEVSPHWSKCWSGAPFYAAGRWQRFNCARAAAFDWAHLKNVGITKNLIYIYIEIIAWRWKITNNKSCHDWWIRQWKENQLATIWIIN